jgi:hypothetical protein
MLIAKQPRSIGSDNPDVTSKEGDMTIDAVALTTKDDERPWGVDKEGTCEDRPKNGEPHGGDEEENNASEENNAKDEDMVVTTTQAGRLGKDKDKDTFRTGAFEHRCLERSTEFDMTTFGRQSTVKRFLLHIFVMIRFLEFVKSMELWNGWMLSKEEW